MQYLIRLSFLGTAYHGFQAQPGVPSLQRILTEACSRLFDSPCSVKGCSRTDAGVHAKNYCITVLPAEPHAAISPAQIPRGLCALLPHDIGVYEAIPVPDSFHPRYSAKGKEYEYLIDPAPLRNPFRTGRVWQRPMPCDGGTLADLSRAAEAFCGTHDFTSFMASGSSIQDPVRTVLGAEVGLDGDLIRFRVAADGFLYNMVRIMAGTLYGVASGRFAPDDIAGILDRHDRTCAGVTAPPEGLYLSRVFYEEPYLPRFSVPDRYLKDREARDPAAGRPGQ